MGGSVDIVTRLQFYHFVLLQHHLLVPAFGAAKSFLTSGRTKGYMRIVRITIKEYNQTNLVNVYIRIRIKACYKL